MSQVTFTIDGMTCNGCIASVRRALTRAGIADATIELGRCTVSADVADQAHTAIDGAGFVATPTETRLAPAPR